MIQPLDPLDPGTYLNSAELRRFKALTASKLQDSTVYKNPRRPGRKSTPVNGITLRQWAQLTQKSYQRIHQLHQRGRLMSWLEEHGFIDKDLLA